MVEQSGCTSTAREPWGFLGCPTGISTSKSRERTQDHPYRNRENEATMMPNAIDCAGQLALGVEIA